MDLRWSDASEPGDLILRREPDLLIHRQLHDRPDYEVGDTRVVANPRGPVEERGSGFVPDMTVDVPTGAKWALAEVIRLGVRYVSAAYRSGRGNGPGWGRC